MVIKLTLFHLIRNNCWVVYLTVSYWKADQIYCLDPHELKNFAGLSNMTHSIPYVPGIVRL